MNIFLSGYFSGNLGDDLFLHIITSRYPDHQFHAMIHGDYASIYQGIPNLKVLPQTKLLRGLDKLLFKFSPSMSLYARKGKKMDGSVLIGGSMFQELSDDGSDLIRLAQMPQNYGHLYIAGINFGPCKTEQYKNAVCDYLSKATDVCFRDKTSYGHFMQLPNTRLGSDIVFGVEAICPKAECKINTCVISVMDFSAKKALAAYEEAYLDLMKKLLLQQQAEGRTVTLVSFCRSEGDETGIEKLLRILPKEKREAVTVLRYNGTNWKQICQTISSADYLVASRFHSMVLGLCYGVPTVAISYNNKTLQLLEDLGYADLAVLPNQFSNLPLEDIHPVPPIDLSAQKTAAQLHFSKLDVFLDHT